MMMGEPKYTSKTHVGNWREEEELHRLRRLDYQRRRELGQTATTALGSSLAASSKTAELSPSDGGVVHYGDIIMLACDKANGAPLCVDPDECLRPGDLSATDVCAVTAAPTLKGRPTPRNAFIIVRFDDGRAPPPSGEFDTSVVKYNDKFLLASHPACPKQLFLRSTKRTPSIFSRATKKQEVATTSTVGPDAAWVFKYYDPQLRFEKEGQPVEISDKVVIAHNMTNECLWAAEVPVPSNNGLEYEVCCNTALDFKRAEGPENLWTIVMGSQDQ
eukprot:m51a1_g6161 hypothetical protein (274) ;mRNA; r:333277-334302